LTAASRCVVARARPARPRPGRRAHPPAPAAPPAQEEKKLRIKVNKRQTLSDELLSAAMPEPEAPAPRK